MNTPIEAAHQAIKTGPGFAAAAASAGMTEARLADILHGRVVMTAHKAARIGAVAGLGAALTSADTDTQLSLNRGTAL